MKYSPRPFEALLTRFIARQAKAIEKLIDQHIDEATRVAGKYNISTGGEDFFFKDHPALSREIDKIIRNLSNKITAAVTAGNEWSWDLANVKNDDLLTKILSSIGRTRVPKEAIDRWSQKNLPALAAFEERRIGGMNLSDKVWSYTSAMRGDLELALDLGLGEGMSADRLSRSVRQYLKEPQRLYRRVRDEKGILRLSKSASNYHPGQGVYRSSYKNARRLAATETNMAYRTADNERMNQIDFILGYEVHLSNNHTCLDSKGIPRPFHDICDELEGQYPKWFIFKGWHPLCRCYVTTILPDKDEFMKYVLAMDENGVSSYHLEGEITEMPPQFNEWMQDNEERMEQAMERDKLPYFLRDNMGVIRPIGNGLDSEFAAEAKKAGIKRVAPMSFEDANAGRENPFYNSGAGYYYNCQSCVVAHEARRRGFDVEALPNINGDAHKKISWLERFLNEDGSKVNYEWAGKWQRAKGYERMSFKRTQEFLNETISADGRYEIYVKWRGVQSAHVFLAEKGESGIFFFDPQMGRPKPPSAWIDKIDASRTMVLRIDNKKINPKAVGLLTPAHEEVRASNAILPSRHGIRVGSDIMASRQDGMVRDMMSRARQVGDELQSMAEGVAGKINGAAVTPINYKSYDSIVDKMRRDNMASPFDMKDTVRNTIVVSRDNIPRVLDYLREQPGFMRIKEQSPEAFMGYSGNIVNIRLSNGIVGEIQVNTPEMIFAKEKPNHAKAVIGEKKWEEIAKRTGLEGGLGHTYYEEARKLAEGSIERIYWEKLSMEYYRHFR